MPVLCRARGAGRGERMPGGRSAHPSGRCLASSRWLRRCHPRRRWRRPVPRSPGRSTPSQPETRFPAGDTPPQAETLSPLLSLASLALSSGQDPSSVLVAMTTKTDEGSRLGSGCSQGRSACWRHGGRTRRGKRSSNCGTVRTRSYDRFAATMSPELLRQSCMTEATMQYERTLGGEQGTGIGAGVGAGGVRGLADGRARGGAGARAGVVR